ncbi:MAG: FKBP-type peptidyl-prolyl cis-trans isomerase [Treponema sp.]|nr:FKBP-type peptidyl-prolyl cis-trans isomerase [Treponema sp.]
MKKLTFVFCIFLCVTALHARAIQEDYRKAEEKSRLSYALGMWIGMNYDLSDLGLEFDYTALAEGVKAVMEKDVEPQFGQQEAMEIIETAIYNAMEKIAEVNRAAEEEYLFKNSQRYGIHVTQSGLQYEILAETAGEKPQNDSIVRVHYSGSLTDGTLFDESYEADGAYIPLDMVIPGWTEGVMLMGVGSKYRFYIPSNLAYGKDGIQGYVPAFSTLIFDVELLEIVNDDSMFNPYYDWE